MQGKWRKAPLWLVELFDRALPLDPRAERRAMFGFPAAFASGHMFTGLFEESLFVRLGEAERADLLAIEGAALFEPMPGRPMREYVVLPPALLEEDAAVTTWMKRGLAFAVSLPAKAKAKAGAKRNAGARTAPPKTRPSPHKRAKRA